MGLDTQDWPGDGQPAIELQRSQSTRGSSRQWAPGESPSSEVETPDVVARVPKPHERIPERRTIEPPEGPESEHSPGDHGHAGAPRNGRLRRHPLLSGISATLLLATVGFGYLYWDYTGHFESTDDAFIAARQFSIAPKVSGYVSSVAVTDNQHVNAGDVVARVDDRDYRTALAQTQAQVSATQASIQNFDAQIDVQQAQISASQAQLFSGGSGTGIRATTGNPL
ncbi:hypothetical protein ACVWWG_005162 [Bradyrhizobium sp. LB7.2]